MSDAAPDEHRLFEEALDLIIRVQNDPGNPITLDMVRRWRGQGLAHERAWGEVAEIHGMTGKILTDRRNGARKATRRVARRNVVIGGLVGAGVLAGGYATMPRLLVEARADFVTRTAEIRRVPLADGSIVTLGPESAIALHLGEQERVIDLLTGEAFFEVEKDAARPFRTRVESLTATALGTAFDVANDPDAVTVTVDNGVVTVQFSHSETDNEARLDAGQWARFDRYTPRVARGSRDIRQIAAWRDGLIIADNEAVGLLIAQIGRWVPGRIVIADIGLKSRRVSGVFDLKNPLRALEAVVHPLGGHVRQLAPHLTVVSPI